MSRRRFYKDVSIDAVQSGEDGLLHRVLLDGKPLKTPGGGGLALPSQALAHAIAEEWSAQDAFIRPETMILTKLANTAIDRVAPNPAIVREQLLSFAASDVVCYRAEEPAELVERQRRSWDPILSWARGRFGISLRTSGGLAFVEQDKAAITALDAALSSRDVLSLAALSAAAALCGSVLIALALSEQELNSEEAFAAANLDKIYQAERWGWDEKEIAKSTAERNELNQISRFLELSAT